MTPIDHVRLNQLLIDSGYDKSKARFLVDGFKNGFSIGYNGEVNVKQYAPNLKLTVGSEIDLWNKVMKEVKLKRYAGPYEEVPFDSFIQSPIGLVPKDHGNDTRLIFHLSYPRCCKQSKSSSLNANMPRELCHVRYRDFDFAIKRCLEEGNSCFLAISDVKSAFRNLGISPQHWKYLVMKAKNPVNGRVFYFIDKCLPFGAAISCALFQAFSDAIAHIIKWRNGDGRDPANYLDDFLFIALLKLICQNHLDRFMEVCEYINLPISIEKTQFPTMQLVFLGLLIDTIQGMVFLPVEKISRGRELIQAILNKKSRKVTIKELQKICGFLNFLGRAVVPGRAFTRRLYSYTRNKNLMPHYHVKITQEMHLDFEMWLMFLHHHSTLARPFLDFTSELTAEVLDMYSDASLNPNLGMGATFRDQWTFKAWNPDFVRQMKPSIEYLELYALLTGVVLFGEHLKNKRIILFCDNESVVEMVNSTSSKCKNCMVLIRLLVLEGLTNNVRIFAKHVSGKSNYFSDSLSRLDFIRFNQLQTIHNKKFREQPEEFPDKLWPIDKIWLK